MPQYIPEQSENGPGGDPVPEGEGSALIEEDATPGAAKRQRFDEPSSPAQSPQYATNALCLPDNLISLDVSYRYLTINVLILYLI